MESNVILHLKVKAGARQEGIVGFIELDGKQYLKLHIRQVAEDGKANKYIIKYLSKILSVPQMEIELISGHKSNLKTISIKNITSSYLNSCLSHYI